MLNKSWQVFTLSKFVCFFRVLFFRFFISGVLLAVEVLFALGSSHEQQKWVEQYKIKFIWSLQTELVHALISIQRTKRDLISTPLIPTGCEWTPNANVGWFGEKREKKGSWLTAWSTFYSSFLEKRFQVLQIPNLFDWVHISLSWGGGGSTSLRIDHIHIIHIITKLVFYSKVVQSYRQLDTVVT